MKSRLLSAVTVTALVIAIATACTPGASPSPTPTPTFSTEAEAFAAAEATYRAYVDALNQVDLSDPDTFEALYTLTTGEANAADRKIFSEMHASEWVVSGTTRAPLIEPIQPAPDALETVDLAVCLDVTDVTLVDRSGESVVDADRSDVQSLTVTLTSDLTAPTGFLISKFVGREGAPSCAA